MMKNESLDDAVCSSSFTALLELPPTQVVKLLHLDDVTTTTAPPIDSLQFAPTADDIPDPPLEVRKAAVKRKLLPERMKRKKIKDEKDEEEEVLRGYRNRKKKSKKEDIARSQLPYVHVRALRGQATDSHSLAERARREKINARMKLLQEMVPGCSQISGIALVLDEIINHVQALQRQVEFLSMQLAAINPRSEFNHDHFLDEENAFVDGSFLSTHPTVEWSDPQVDGMIGFKQSFVQQWQCNAYQQPHWLTEENHLESATMPVTTHLTNNSSPDTGFNATEAAKSGASINKPHKSCREELS